MGDAVRALLRWGITLCPPPQSAMLRLLLLLRANRAQLPHYLLRATYAWARLLRGRWVTEKSHPEVLKSLRRLRKRGAPRVFGVVITPGAKVRSKAHILVPGHAFISLSEGIVAGLGNHIDAFLAHGVARIARARTTAWLILVSVVAPTAVWVHFVRTMSAAFGAHPVVVFVRVTVVAVLFGVTLYAFVSRHLTYLADKDAARLLGSAQALIVALKSAQDIDNRGTHPWSLLPPIERRIARLENMHR